MEISIVIPCFNVERTLGAQLTALAEQDFDRPREVIIADNGSTDGTVSVAESFRGCLPELVIVSAHEQRGAAYARNRGASVARSDFLAFCDADDVVAPGYLRAIFKALTQHEFVACRYAFENLNEAWIAKNSGFQTSAVSRGLVGPYTYAAGGGLGIRRSAHKLVGGFDGELFSVLEDADYCIRLQRLGIALHFAPEAVIHYRWRSTVRAAFRQARNWGRECVDLRARHWPTEVPPETPASFIKHLLLLRRVRSGGQLAKWIWASGWRLGLIEGWSQQRKRRTPYFRLAPDCDAEEEDRAHPSEDSDYAQGEDDEQIPNGTPG